MSRRPRSAGSISPFAIFGRQIDGALFCMPGSVSSLVEVLPRQPIPRTGSRLAMQGRFELRRDPESYGFLYRMLDAAPTA